MKNALILLLCAVTLLAQAQPDTRQKKESIKAQKVGYLSTKIGLSVDDAKKFWPIYDEREAELGKIRKERRNARRTYREGADTKTEKELEILLDKQIELRGKEHEVIKRYHDIFKRTIGVKKTARLYRAEDQFHKKLVKGVRERAHQGGRPGPPRGN